ncbi:MAG TPA: hypothetical protein VGH81_12465 [Rudaea sp.]
MKRFPNFHNVALLAAAACLGACSMFSSHSDYYTKAAENRPLEVPPDLDTPASANELVVPNAGSGAANAAAAAPSAQVPARAELHVDGGVMDTWKSVGSALQRSKLGTVTARDEATHSYAFDFDAEVESQSGDGHWFSAVLHHLGFGEGEHVKHPLSVSVSDDSGGSRISVDGNGTDRSATYAAQRIGKELAASVSGAKVLAPVAAAPVAAPMPATEPPSATMPPVAPAAAPAVAPAAVSAAPPAISGVSVAGTDLHVTDTVANTWQRVGLAIERAQIGTLSARDENSRTYTLAFDSTVETPAAESEHHWYTRILHPFGGGKAKTEKVARALTVRVSDDAGGARVSVEGDMSDKATAEAARRVVQVLRDRLS